MTKSYNNYNKSNANGEFSDRDIDDHKNPVSKNLEQKHFYKTVCNCARVRMRNYPNTVDSDTIHIFDCGEKVETNGKSNGNFTGVIYDGINGWIMSDYLN